MSNTDAYDSEFEILRSVHSMKKQALCNQQRKNELVQQGAMSGLLSILETQHDIKIQLQAIQAIGSLCTVNEGILKTIEAGGLCLLLQVLSKEYERLAKPILWVLKLISQV